MELYGLKACDTCRRAVRELREAGREVTFVDIREAPLDQVVRARLVETFGARILNTRSTTWRSLTEAERAGDPATLLSAHPALMKRPVIARNEKLYLGWDAAVRSALL